MTKYRKKPVVIEAVQVKAADYNRALPWDKAWDSCPFSEIPDWLGEAIEAGMVMPHNRGSTDYAGWDVKTLEGTMSGGPGDWLIQGVKGELYFCKPDIFAATYEPAETRLEKPTIAELEAILNEPSTPVHINQDGSVTVETK